MIAILTLCEDKKSFVQKFQLENPIFYNQPIDYTIVFSLVKNKLYA